MKKRGIQSYFLSFSDIYYAQDKFSSKIVFSDSCHFQTSREIFKENSLLLQENKNINPLHLPANDIINLLLKNYLFSNFKTNH